jgi:pyruvate/2-oxoglutarate dehydrogenase complex dihydrolipoamide acyltransferase (E2) component
MAQVVVMPIAGQTMEEGSVDEWLKNEGDTVRQGEPLLTIISDKATLEIESDYSGVLKKILKTSDDGDMPCLTPIAIIGAPDEVIDVEKVLAEFQP